MPKYRYNEFEDRDLQHPTYAKPKKPTITSIYVDGNYEIKKDYRMFYLYRGKELIGFYWQEHEAMSALKMYKRYDNQ